MMYNQILQKFSCLCIVAVILFFNIHISHAVDYEIIYTPSGNPLFQYHYYNKDEIWTYGTDSPQTSTYTLDSYMRGEIHRASEYWANIIGNQALNTKPINFVIGTYDEQNADATSLSYIYDNISTYEVPLKIIHGDIGTGEGFSAQIRMGKLPWNMDNRPPANLPNNGKTVDVFSVMHHELLHALGVSSGIDTTLKFNNKEHFFDTHLYNESGVQVQPGMQAGDDIGRKIDSTYFYVGKPLAGESNPYSVSHTGNVYFKGDNVAQVIRGAQLGAYQVNGIPINAWEQDAQRNFFLELSHIELENSMMSHQSWRNYTYYMEAELAVLQDIGYTIDRKNHFGDSVYESGVTWISTHGYGVRDANGTLYIDNQYNTAMFGVGLHVYGSNNTLTQKHDILSSGIAGTGIRIDGVANTLTIPQGTRIHAIGDYSTGLLVAYGKEHNIVHQGHIMATGLGGVGMQFDFGDNAMGNATAFRGSYMATNDEVAMTTFDVNSAYNNLNGALVNSVDITGSVQGNLAAIYIASNAHVRTINIMQGASLQGNIISNWDPNDTRIVDGKQNQYYTDLNFGYLADSASKATAGPDTNFYLLYNGNIIGEKSLKTYLQGGTLAFNGIANVYSWDIKAGATLRGNSEITINGTAPFTNAGTIAPGNNIGIITIKGNFTNTGELQMEFDGKGSTDRLNVSGTFFHDTGGGGTVSVSPTQDYYSGSQAFSMASMFSGDASSSTLPSSVDTFAAPLSPTLQMQMTPGVGTFTITTSRAANAYSRFAPTSNAAQAGHVLSGIAEVAQGDMQELFAALDFSALDGSDIRTALPQLTAAPYAQTAQASAEGNLNMGRMAVAYLRTAGAPMTAGRGQAGTTGLAGGSDSAPQWSAFVMPFGGASQQQAHKGTAGYNSSDVGLMGGVYRQTDHVTLSLYTALSRRQVDMWTTAGAQARSNALHVGTAALWQEKTDHGWQVWGLVQLGMENTDMRRSVAFAGFARENMSSWTSLNGVTTVGAGYLWRVGALSFGPQIGMEYAFNALPAVEERNGGATRLGTEAHVRHDLRGVAGLMTAWNIDLGGGRGLCASLEAVWRQDMLPPQRNVRTHFVGYSQFPFDSRVERAGQGSLGLTGGVQVNLRKDVILSAQVEADVLRHGYSSVGGGLSLRWEF